MKTKFGSIEDFMAPNLDFAIFMNISLFSWLLRILRYIGRISGSIVGSISSSIVGSINSGIIISISNSIRSL
jgi:hypothetical protein